MIKILYFGQDRAQTRPEKTHKLTIFLIFFEFSILIWTLSRPEYNIFCQIMVLLALPVIVYQQTQIQAKNINLGRFLGFKNCKNLKFFQFLSNFEPILGHGGRKNSDF